MINGLLLEVRADERATAVTATAAVGATAVPVEDLTPFGDDGGRVDIAGTVYDYTGIDSSTVNADGEGGSLLLASGLTVAVAEFDPVSVLVGGEIAVDVVAVVELGADDEAGEPVEVPLETREERLAWPVQVYEPPLPVSLSDDLESIVKATGAMPVMDATLTSSPMLMAAKGANQTIANNTWTAIDGWFILQDDRITADAAGKVLTVQVDGVYDLRVGVSFDTSAVGSRAVQPHIYGPDGTDYGPLRLVKLPADGRITVETAQYVRLVAGQSVTFEAWQSSGANLDVRGSNVFLGQPVTDCAIRWVGPL